MPVFQTPPTVLTGIGCFDRLGEHAAALGGRCLLVTGKRAMQEQGIFARAIDLLGRAGIKTAACTGVEHDPTLASVDQARDVLARNACEFVVGLGGGSSLDVAKAAAGLAREQEPTRAFFEGKPLGGSGLPVVAVPSTFGTGSESTRVAVLTDPANGIKQSIRHDCMLPRVCIVDPVIGAGAPPQLTAACGMDALTQALESYISQQATDLTRALSFSAIVLLIAGLERSFRDGQDLEARENCANASLMAGMALHNARLGLVHGIAHPLGIRHGLPHGVACGALLPHVLRFNREAAAEHYRLFSSMVGADIADFCAGLLKRLGLPADLRHLRLDAAEISEIARLTMPSGSTGANPRKVTREDVEALLREVCGVGA